MSKVKHGIAIGLVSLVTATVLAATTSGGQTRVVDNVQASCVTPPGLPMICTPTPPPTPTDLPSPSPSPIIHVAVCPSREIACIVVPVP